MKLGSLHSDFNENFNRDRIEMESMGEAINDQYELMIEKYGWHSVYNCLVLLLLNDEASYAQHELAASRLFEAAMDGEKMNVDLVIGLVYERLRPDEYSSVSNLAWNIACLLKGLDYTYSDYNPQEDPEVQNALVKARGQMGTLDGLEG